ncbi:MAG TPA: 2-dehydro-3-deoxy-6-phosphogalactonate aldolase [Steroidobacteraceae bacterium]|nr:2-dehydro-3-deoxy-6-phosphogalactonate aldolase [Steroidobacteraceae bacterium]
MQPTDLPNRDHAIIAILRGIEPNEVEAVGSALYASGIRVIEVPLNSPNACLSISALAAAGYAGCLIGGGTVLKVDEVNEVYAAGGRLIVSPNCNSAVIARALELNMQVMPGVATATEAFSAIEAGARKLKLFPAATYGPRHLRSLRAVLPDAIEVYPVSGIVAGDIKEWLEAGANGFGFGTEIYRKGYSAAESARRAGELVDAYRKASRC